PYGSVGFPREGEDDSGGNLDRHAAQSGDAHRSRSVDRRAVAQYAAMVASPRPDAAVGLARESKAAAAGDLSHVGQPDHLHGREASGVFGRRGAVAELAVI